MAAARLPAPKNPMLMGALVIGGLWFIGRARAQSAAVAGTRRTPGQDYSTPTAVAANFARSIVALTRNLSTAFDPNGVGTPAAPLDIAGISTPGTLGGWTFGTGADRYGGLGDPVFGWSPPNQSVVRNVSVSQYGSEVDQIPAAPLYNPTTDFTNNPTGFGAGSYDFGG